MTRVESGPARTDSLWRLLQAALFLGFSGWFVLDGAYLYPATSESNARAALERQPFSGQLDYDALPVVPANPEEDLKRLNRERTERLSGVVEVLGGEPNFHEGDDHYWVGRYGWIKVTAPGGAVNLTQARHNVWYKSRSTIREQFYWALIPLPIGLFFLYKLYRAATLKVVVDEQGLLYGGQRIPFGAMQDLRDFNKRGWIDLYYDDGGRSRRLRLDWEKIARFDEVVAAICAAKGFPNAVEEWRRHEEREHPADDEETESVPTAEEKK